MQMFLLLHLVGGAVFMDVLTRRIPNGWVAAGFLCGLAYQVMDFRGRGFWSYCFGILVPFLSLWFLYYFRMIGAGDIKLLSMMGGFLGPEDIFSCMIYSFLFGGIISAVVVIRKRNLFYRLFYFKCYLSRYLETKQWCPYIGAEKGDGCIYFTIPVFFSFLCYLGGVY